MNAEQIIRNIKLHLLVGVELKEPYLSIYNDLQNIFSCLNIYISEDFPQLTFYGKSKDNLYIECDSKNEDIWLSYDNVWSKFESKYDLPHEHIQEITTWYLGNTLQMKGTTATGSDFLIFPTLRNTFQMKGKNVIK